MLNNNLLLESFNYTNQRVLDRYTKDYPQNKMPANEAFCELVKYMWLCFQHRIDSQSKDPKFNFTCVMHTEMQEIDHMWHTFLLFTKDYQDFCLKYFGEFFHHQPLSENDKNIPAARYQLELENYLSYIYDKLGEQTLRKWFSE